jgi:PAS domain-containing protein
MVLRDVTDRRRLEEAVQKATELAAEQAPDETDAFAGETHLELPADSPIDEFREEAPRVAVPVSPVAPVATPDRRPLRDLEADLHRISGTARATFQELGSLLRDAESQHDEALSRQADEYARLKAVETEHWRFYETFVEAATHGVFRATPDGRLLHLNPSMAAALGYGSPAGVLAASDAIGVLMDASNWDEAVGKWRDRPGEPIDTPWLTNERQALTLRLYGRVIDNPNGGGECLEVVAENITAQRALEAQLRRARRWEDVARVTSGIAADLGHVVATVNDSTDLDAIHLAASKAVALSRQLVAFGRREARDRAALDLNAVVSRMADVLRRLTDEHIELTFGLTSSLLPVLAAQPPLEEGLVNLTVVAAEVLPAGGRLHYDSSTVMVDALNAEMYPGLEPGSYGVISLTATGWGIDVSKGHGSAERAVGQAGGTLRLEHAGGDSVTFKVYLPHVQRGETLRRDE